MSDNSYDDVRLTPARRFVLAMMALLVGGLAAAVLSIEEEVIELRDLALGNLEASGVGNPVTAVLLNYRSYDTFLEVAVLLLALIGIWAVAKKARIPIKSPNTPVLITFERLFMPLMIVSGGYLLWLGADRTGGAFQAGAVLGALGVLWVAASLWTPNDRLRRLTRPALVVGMAAFLLVGGGMMLLGGDFFEYPREDAKTWILLIETAATISIGITLVMLFIGGIPPNADQNKGESGDHD